MAIFLVARNNKLTGAAGVMGFLRVMKVEDWKDNLYQRAEKFPLSISARAEWFNYEDHPEDWPTKVKLID